VESIALFGFEELGKEVADELQPVRPKIKTAAVTETSLRFIIFILF
jgi:hypothetical protein